MLLMKVLLLSLAAVPVLLSVRRYFSYNVKPRTWLEAQKFCRSNDKDLATAVKSADLRSISLKKFEAWFGLKSVSSSWLWVDDDYSSSRKRRFLLSWLESLLEQAPSSPDITEVFASGQPEPGQECGKVKHEDSKAYSDLCDQKWFVFCKNTSSSYTFLPEAKTWVEGLQYCKDHAWKYMAFPGMDPFDFKSTSAYGERDFPVWIGLRYDGGVWNWSDGTHSDYRAWVAGSDPGPSPDNGSCVAVSSLSYNMTLRPCSEYFPSVCYRHNLVLVHELLTWEEALETCRTLGNSSPYELLSLEESELMYALSYAQEATTSKVWIGLRFLHGSWFWADGFPLTLPSLPNCPEPSLHCGAMVLNSSSIEPSNCSQKFNVLCYK